MTIELAPDDDYAEPVEPVNVTPPRTVHNASTTDSYVSEMKAPARGEGAMAAYRIPSKTSFSGDSTSRSGCASTAGEA